MLKRKRQFSGGKRYKQKATSVWGWNGVFQTEVSVGRLNLREWEGKIMWVGNEVQLDFMWKIC